MLRVDAFEAKLILGWMWGFFVKQIVCYCDWKGQWAGDVKPPVERRCCNGFGPAVGYNREYEL